MRVIKRSIDIVLGTILVVFALPLMLVGSVCLTVAFRHFPFFMQDRIGFGGRPLRFPKLRTLPSSVPAYALKTEISFDDLPRSGKFLRKVHFDELPQLFLVVMGRLSLVGPRPKMPDDVEPCDEEYGRLRVTVPQGCTGLWQISVDKSGIPDKTPEYDLFYVAHRSNRFDMWILWRTLMNGLHIGKLVTLDDIPKWVYKGDKAVPTAVPVPTPTPAAVRYSGVANS
jgi:lipopolysaccharide/colanic/teichoic acid biosynthesis glycosyltransferase